MVQMITYERSTLDERRKVYWAGRSSSSDLGRGDGFPGKLIMESILETKELPARVGFRAEI